MEVVVTGHILKVYYPRTIHAMFALNWLTGFRREDFSTMLKLCLLTAAISQYSKHVIDDP
jgi:hypothetical protein